MMIQDILEFFSGKYRGYRVGINKLAPQAARPINANKHLKTNQNVNRKRIKLCNSLKNPYRHQGNEAAIVKITGNKVLIIVMK